ncbi:MAG: ATP-binding protein [Candidatus Diapherotrites archaeon]|nr:ATP-binding protein [Candidatus Diapherotrites archaeon]
MKVGVVISTEDGPSPTRVDFVVTEGVVHQGQYVEIDSPQGRMLALVEDVIKTNRYFGQPEIVREYELRSSLSQNFPVKEWEFLVGVARPMIVWNDAGTERPTLPPSPGAEVRVPHPEDLKRFLGFNEDGLHIGSLQFHDVLVSLDINRLIQKHFAILAMSGAGKSYTTSVILEEILDRRPEQGRIGVVVFDVHGEYVGFGDPVSDGEHVDYSDRTTVLRVSDLRIPVPSLSANDFTYFIPDLSPAQRRELDRIISAMKSDMEHGSGPYDLADLIDRIAADEVMKDSTRGALISWLRSLEKTGLFDAIERPAVDRIVRPGEMVVFDLSSTLDAKVRQMVVAYFSKRLFDLRREGRIPPTLMVIEEAHNFIPSDIQRTDALARGTLETIAREGRKFGLGLCLISQRPVKLSSTALSQCNTHIILRITNPYDLNHVAESSEGIDSRSAKMITNLRPGEAIIVGAAVNFPVFVRVRRRKSQESKYEKSLVEMAREFEEKMQKVEEDLALL